MRDVPGDLVVVGFAGGGGSSQGIRQALGRDPDIGINHDPVAVAMHAANHPGTTHHCQNIWQAHPHDLVGHRKVGLAWFSPDCRHFSKAKGGRPVNASVRDLAWVVVAWAKTVRPRIVILENVEEFAGWGPLTTDGKPCAERAGQTFRQWCAALKRLGYRLDWRELRACDYGAPTIRRRLYLIARCDGLPIAWPEPTHGPGRLPYRTAAEIIDWSLPCPSIFLTREEGRALGCKRPLVDATMRRIAKGVVRYVLQDPHPFVVTYAQQGGRGACPGQCRAGGGEDDGMTDREAVLRRAWDLCRDGSWPECLEHLYDAGLLTAGWRPISEAPKDGTWMAVLQYPNWGDEDGDGRPVYCIGHYFPSGRWVVPGGGDVVPTRYLPFTPPKGDGNG